MFYLTMRKHKPHERHLSVVREEQGVHLRGEGLHHDAHVRQHARVHGLGVEHGPLDAVHGTHGHIKHVAHLVEYSTGHFTQFMSWCSTGQVILHSSCLGIYSTGQVILHSSCLGIVQDRSFYTVHVLV